MSASRRLASLGGRVLACVFGAVSRLRPTLKPLHPSGECLSARIERNGLTPGTGVAWLDKQGQDDVQSSSAATSPARSPSRDSSVSTA